jgi:hypothetical protein
MLEPDRGAGEAPARAEWAARLRIRRTASPGGRMRVNWYWGFLGFLGVLGFAFHSPAWFGFFAFFLFFLEPLIRRSKR